jgi:hypothetical protein
MFRKCAAIPFVCFDMTACDTLNLFSSRMHLVMKCQQTDKETTAHKADCAEFSSNCALK